MPLFVVFVYFLLFIVLYIVFLSFVITGHHARRSLSAFVTNITEAVLAGCLRPS